MLNLFKNRKSFCIIFLSFSIFSFFLFSCKNQELNNLQNIENSTYFIYQISGERGYKVHFEMEESEALPKAVIINGIKQKISNFDKNGNSYDINVISQTEIIANHKIETSEKPNGIIFQIQGKEIFQPVEFTLKSN